METQDRSFKVIGRKTEYNSTETVVGDQMQSKDLGKLLLKLLQFSHWLDDHMSEQAVQLRVRWESGCWRLEGKGEVLK